MSPPAADPGLPPLQLLSVVIPARDEEGCIASTVEHLHVELRLHEVPHEIVVVDDGSTDRTWEILQESASMSAAEPCSSMRSVFKSLNTSCMRSKPAPRSFLTMPQRKKAVSSGESPIRALSGGRFFCSMI